MQAWMRQLGLATKPRATAAEQAQPEQKKSLAAAALAAAKAAASAAGASRAGTVTVAEQRRFAGKTITVNKEVAADSKEAQLAVAEAEAAAAEKRKAGLDAVLASLQQAKKVRWGPRVTACSCNQQWCMASSAHCRALNGCAELPAMAPLSLYGPGDGAGQVSR
jgi:hypothetical protein